MNAFSIVAIASLLVLGVSGEVSYTNTTFPTKTETKSVEVESTNAKVEVTVRTFNTSGVDYPTINCTSSSSKVISADFTWTWANGSNFVQDDGVKAVRRPETGTLDKGAVTSSLRFEGFATGAAKYAGKYKCTIGSTSYSPVVSTAPVVKMSEKDYRSVMEGDTLTQNCAVVAYPTPVVIWKKNGEIVVADGTRIKFATGNRTMTITELQKADAGVYVCSANNDLGIGESYIKLRVKDRLAALWPFLGIVAEVVILVTIILLYERKRAAQKRNQEENDAAEVKDDRNANDSDVRHRAVKT